MAAWAVRTLWEASDPVVLLGGDGTLARRMGLPWRADGRPGCGPLAGLATGLRWAIELERSGILVLACDLPLVTSALMTAILEGASGDVDAVVPEDHAGEPQPLCAWYDTSALRVVEARLDGGEHSMHGLLAELRVRTLREADSSDPTGTTLLNVNTPNELELAARAKAHTR
jgi:molybdopterin-guanine dinucleotide biosynthesis protein A